MNYLSHHHLARSLTTPDTKPPEFYTGNVLPDLLALAGDGRLRASALEGAPPADPLVRGILLHHAADHWFHSHPVFKAATEDVSALLRSASFAEPPRRLFFVAHVFVELALDAAVFRVAPDTADDLYRMLAAVPTATLAARAAAWQGQEVGTRMALPGFLHDFIAAGYLRDYARSQGLAGAMSRVSQRAHIDNFRTREDRERLADAFIRFSGDADTLLATLFAPGAFTPALAW